MKQIAVLSFFLLVIFVCPAQNKSNIRSVEPGPKAGVANIFIYTPAKNIAMPDKIQAVVVYQNKQQFFTKTLRLYKTGNNYRFSFKAPDSTSVLIFGITVPGKIIPEKNSLVLERKIVFDNNNEEGFIVYLHDKTGKRFTYEQIDLEGLFDDYAIYEFALKEKSTRSLISLFENSYRLYPELKNQNTYLDYLSLLYKENEEQTKPKLLNYADQLLQIKNDESKWINASRIYGMLNMADEKKQVENDILKVFPDGERAKGNYWGNFYTRLDTTEEAMMATMNNYITRFNDNTTKTKDLFYTSFISTSINRKDWSTALRYSGLVYEKIKAASVYNYNAWKLSGKQTDNAGSELENAKTLSARSIAISTALMNDGTQRDEDALSDLKDIHYHFYDTYALILYKLGQYDSAFYYQDLVSRQGKELNTGGMERYAAYAEKAKGTAFTKQFLEAKLLAGNKSPVMMKQLQAIYKQLNLPENEFARLQDISLLLAKQKNDAAIKAMYGSLTAPDFSLKNMLGETINLYQLKNKVVVLDFWATWCGPCKASFPTMQQLVDKYKNDEDVVFLFIDTRESTEFSKNLETVKKYIADNKYSFNVLFDVKSKMAQDYKVDGIPQKFVLDKNGKLVYTGGPQGLIDTNEHLIEDMSAIIDAAKKISLNPNTKLPKPVLTNPGSNNNQ